MDYLFVRRNMKICRGTSKHIQYTALQESFDSNEYKWEVTKWDGSENTNAKKFRSLIGVLHYLVHSRHDISFFVTMVSRYMHSPTKHQFGVAKRITGTLNFGLWYEKFLNYTLISYTYNDREGSLDDRKST